MARTVIPFGPQHPVFPEPVQLKLECEDETVVGVTPVIGYVHRGVEKACEINTLRQNIFLVERICGICSIQHALCYCQGIEELAGIEIPQRAHYLRTAWAELSRLHSHSLWLGLLADALGFESLFMQIWRAREIILDILEMTAGHRVITSACVVGGVRRDIDDEMLKKTENMLGEFRKMMDKTILPTLLNDPTLKKRTVGKGILSYDQAVTLGSCGPTMRGSGVSSDVRSTGYAAFKELGFEPVVETAGDSYARTLVRTRELYQSIDLTLAALHQMPAGEIMVKADAYPEGEIFTRVEQPRGELTYYIKANGTNHLDRCKIRTPTFANIPTLLVMLPGCELADVPVITLSIDPCISCTER
ncbi:NADH dehydrogenase [Dehalococcoides mccartyi]|jgi:ech hydrogenase subunit E|uniref:hydrogenase large subunit n=1 Tax=Dehalococcoides mccartyi TaxID=61435 RepID=UPI0004E0A515|nr:nickel-dependent hydrogenase large subunit [Dehalococcoides mccartyi]AII57946.1 NADH dehydrogenase [Dehalococcoides mccartyi CG1]APH12462.1 NADH dehydrogenase [Dehalococcoides mccartyi]